VMVYLTILYAYGVKVLATQELPKNLVSPLVLAAGLLGMAGAILLEPLHADHEQRGLSLLVRWVPALLLPLLPFAFLAILMRQGQYGWTEFRYLRLAGTVLLAVVAVLGTVWAARKKMPPLASVPGILALGLLLVSVGPWSAQAVSRRDQQRRLRTALREAGIRTPVRLVRPSTETTMTTSYDVDVVPRMPSSRRRTTHAVSAEQYEVIRGTVRYLADAHGSGAVAAVIRSRVSGYDGGWELAAAMPIHVACTGAPGWAVSARVLPLAAVPVRAGRIRELEPLYNPGSLVEIKGQTLLVRDGRETVTGDLRPLVRRLSAARRTGCDQEYGSPVTRIALDADSARIPLRDAAGRDRGEVIFRAVDLRADSAGVATPHLTGGFVLLY
jgi:hypothetical protein